MGIDVSMLMVFCAAIAALALGVMLGYMCCKTLFDVLRFHARLSPAEAQRPRPRWWRRFDLRDIVICFALLSLPPRLTERCY